MTKPAGGSEPVRWGVLSTANIGVKLVIPAILSASNSRLVAIASRDAGRASDASSRYHDVRAHDSYEALLADPEVEAVYIPLPNQLHAEWAIRAARAGKHVLCEKPLAGSAEDARRIVAACREAGVLVLEAFMYRFHPQIRWALDQIAADALGPVRLVRGAFAFDIRTRPNDVRLRADLAGGSLMDVGCYPLNFCRAVYGRAPEAAAARVVVPEGSEVEQSVGAVLDFGDGQLGMFECSFGLAWHQFAEVVGETGRMLLPRPFTPGSTEAVVRIERGDEAEERRFPVVDQYRLEIEHFAGCIRTGAPLAIPPEDAVEQAEAIELIYAAAGYQCPW